MEHRNSTVMTNTGSIRSNRRGLLDTVAHEFFHTWNVERIRPRALEPFDLERANMSGELWLAEGFTQYYGVLSLQRAGIADLRATSEALAEFVEAAVVEPGRAVRSAEDMSRMAVFVDGGTPVDRTNWPTTYTSYYPLGGAIALALDLTLRDRTGQPASTSRRVSCGRCGAPTASPAAPMKARSITGHVASTPESAYPRRR